MKKVIIITLIIVVAAVIFVAAADPIQYWVPPLVEDTNTTSIKINQTVKQGNTTFEIDRVEIGDNYTTIYLEMAPVRFGEELKGTSLFLGDTPLQYISGAYNDKIGCAILYEPIDVTEGLSLHIGQIADYSVTDYEYKLDFKAGQASFTTEIDGKSCNITVIATDNAMEVVCEGLDNLKKSDTATRVEVPAIYELFNENTNEEGGAYFNASHLPTHLRITYTKYEIADEPIIIQIS